MTIMEMLREESAYEDGKMGKGRCSYYFEVPGKYCLIIIITDQVLVKWEHGEGRS